jgi:hypothetical protein
LILEHILITGEKTIGDEETETKRRPVHPAIPCCVIKFRFIFNLFELSSFAVTRSCETDHRMLRNHCHIGPFYGFTVTLMTTQMSPKVETSLLHQAPATVIPIFCTMQNACGFLCLITRPVTNCVGNYHDRCTSYCGLVNDVLGWLIANIMPVLPRSRRIISSKTSSRTGAYFPLSLYC